MYKYKYIGIYIHINCIWSLCVGIDMKLKTVSYLLIKSYYYYYYFYFDENKILYCEWFDTGRSIKILIKNFNVPQLG